VGGGEKGERGYDYQKRGKGEGKEKPCQCCPGFKNEKLPPKTGNKGTLKAWGDEIK